MAMYKYSFIKTLEHCYFKEKYLALSSNGILKSVHRCNFSSNFKILQLLGSNRKSHCFFSRLKSSLHPNENVDLANLDKLESIPDSVISKVKYNCYLSQEAKMSWRKRQFLKKLEAEKEKERRRTVQNTSFCLNYIEDTRKVEAEPSEVSLHSSQFPFSHESLINTSNQSVDINKFYSNRTIDVSNCSKVVQETKNWMKNYEIYNGEELSNSLRSDTKFHINYGTPDKSVPLSKIPCGGCGAYLHCQDTGLPGYLPSELFKNCSTSELRAFKCQRCHFLEQYNIALNLSVSPEEYTSLLSCIKSEVALALVLVDVTNFPCSLWPNIIDIIGTKRPVIVAGNKVDLLPRDSPQFLAYVRQWFENALMESPLSAANVKDIALISAVTGFGIESLITKLFNIWEYQGDVYLLGCTNVGKSTLFNALLQSDYCKVQAADIVVRATTSLWPGTTLNLLKFPILRPKGHRLYERTLRLKELQRQQHKEEQLLRQTLKKEKNPRRVTFSGHIGSTFVNMEKITAALDPFSVSMSEFGDRGLIGLDPTTKDFVTSRWCFDTPGTIHPDQIMDILTAQELAYLLPRQMILPRTFLLFAGDTLLIAGVGRIDFEGEAEKCRFTVFAAESLPITVCKTIDVKEVYESLAAADLLKVPCSDEERLAQWPGLAPASDPIKIVGCDKSESAADIVLSSAGWISVTPNKGETCIIRAWTPFAKGIHLRQPPLMRYSVKLRGKMIRKTPAYFMGKAVDL